MPAYLVAEIEVTDPETYAQYRALTPVAPPTAGLRAERGRRGIPTLGGAASWQAVQVRRVMQTGG